jgi:chromosome segregation ATPase
MTDNPLLLLALAAAGWMLVRKAGKWALEKKSDQAQPAVDPAGEIKEAAKEQAAKEQPAKEEPAKEQAAKEQPAKEQAAKEQPAKEEPAKEQAAKEQPAKEQPAKEQPAKEEPAKEQAAKEQPAKVQPGKEQPENSGTDGVGDKKAGEPATDPNFLFRKEAEVDGKKVVIEARKMTKADGSPHVDRKGRQFISYDYQVDGRSYKFEGTSWFQAPDFSPSHGDVKLHVTTIGAKDLARVQVNLIPKLFEAAQPGGPLHGKLQSFKTQDQMYGIDQSLAGRGTQAPGTTEQGAKGLTLYCVDEVAAKEVYDWCSKTVKELGLTLDGHHDTENVGDTTRDRNGSNRISIERDYYAKGEILIGDTTVEGAIVERKLAEGIETYIQRKATEKAPGWNITIFDAEGRLTQQALDLFLRECEVDGRTCALGYEKTTGNARRLVFVSNGDESHVKGNQYYLDESNAVKKAYYDTKTGEPIELLTGRPAYYRMSEKVGTLFGQNFDPAHLAYERRAESKKTIESVLQRMASEGKDYVSTEGKYKARIVELQPGERVSGVSDWVSVKPGDYLAIFTHESGHQTRGVVTKAQLEAGFKPVEATSTANPADETKDKPGDDKFAKEREELKREIEELRKVQDDSQGKIADAERKLKESAEGAAEQKAQLEKQIQDSTKAQQEAQGKVADLQRKLQESNRTSAVERAQLEKQVQDLTRAQQESQTQVVALQRKLQETESAASSETARLTAQIEALTKSQQESQSKGTDLQRLLQEANDAVKAAAEQKAQLQGEIDRLTKSSSDFQSQIAELERKLIDSTTLAGDEKVRLEKQLQELRSSQQEAQSKITELESKLIGASKATIEAATEKAQLEKQILDLGKAQAEAQDRVAELQKQMREAAAIAAAEKAQSERQLQELTKGQNESQGRIAELETKLRESASAAVTEKAQLEKQVQELTRLQEESAGKVTDLQKSLQRSMTESAAEKQRLENQVSDLTKAQQESAARTAELQGKLQETMAAAVAERTQQESQIEVLSQRQREAREQVVELQGKLKQAGEAISSLSGEKSRLEGEIGRHASEQRDARAKIAELERMLQDSSTISAEQKTKLERQGQDLTVAKNEAQAQVGKLQQDLQRNHEEANARVQEKAQLEKRVQELTRGQQEAQGRISELQAKVQQEATRSAQLEKQVKDLNTLQQESQTRSAELQKRLQDSEATAAAEKTRLEKQIQDLTRSQQDSQTKLVEMHQKLKESEAGAKAAKVELEKQVKDLTTAQEESKGKIAELTEKLKQSGTESAAELGRLKDQIAKLEGQLKETRGRLADRPAATPDSLGGKPAPVTGEVETRGMKIKVGFEAQVGESSWRVVGQDPVDGHVIVMKVGTIDLANKKLQPFESDKFHKIEIAGERGEFYRRTGSDEVYKVVNVDRQLGGQELTGHKFLVLVDEVSAKGPRSPVVSGLADASAQASVPKVEGQATPSGSAFGEADKINLTREIARELMLENGVATCRGQSWNLVELVSKSIKEKKELLEKIDRELARTDGQIDSELPQTRDELVQLKKDLHEKLSTCESAHEQAEKHGNYKPLQDLAAKELPDRIAEGEVAARAGEGRVEGKVEARPGHSGGPGRLRGVLFIFAAALPLVLLKPQSSQAAPVPPVFAPTVPSVGK